MAEGGGAGGGRPAAQLGAWNHLQVPYLGRVPQAAHMSSQERVGVTWHTPTPPLHPYHAPAPVSVSPDPMQVLKVGGASGNSVFRHTPTPPDRETLLYRHTPTPPDKLYRHTPSPGDPKAGGGLPPADIYPIPLQSREKLRAEELLAYARGGVDLTLGRLPANGAPLSLSVRDAPTINSLISAVTARVQPQPRPAHARVDSLLERLTPQPHSPHSVIVHPRAVLSPSPPDSNEDSTDSCGAPPGSKRKRKPDRTVRVPAPPVPPIPHTPPTLPPRTPEPLIRHTTHNPTPPPLQLPQVPPTLDASSRIVPPKEPEPKVAPLENGDGTHDQADNPPSPDLPHTRRKTKSGSSETIDDIAAMIASTDKVDGSARMEEVPPHAKPPEPSDADAPVTTDALKSVLGSPKPSNEDTEEKPESVSPPTVVRSVDKSSENAVAPKRRSKRSSRSDASNAPTPSPSKANLIPTNHAEAKPAESINEKAVAESEPAGESAEPEVKSAEPSVPTFVEVENQLEQMFAGIAEDTQPAHENAKSGNSSGAKKRRRSRAGSTPIRGKMARRSRGGSSVSVSVSVSASDNTNVETKPGRKKLASGRGRRNEGVRPRDGPNKDAYDSGSNASSGRSRGPYVQIRGPRDSPLSVSVVNVAVTADDDCEGAAARPRPRRKGSADGEFRNGLKSRGLHCSTLSSRYDATTPDTGWVCAFCELGPHAGVAERIEAPARPLGDLFGPYTITTDCEEFRALDEQRRRSYVGDGASTEVWFHEECAVWAPGLVAAGARLSGVEAAVWGARGSRCGRCGSAGAGVSCAARACPARAHVNCARTTHWQLDEEDFRAFCPRHVKTA